MIQNKTKNYYILVAIILAIALLAILLSNCIVSFIGEVAKEEISKLEAQNVSIIGEMKTGHSDGDIEITQFTSTGLAMYPGKELYCVNHGTEFGKDSVLRISEALYYGDLEGNIKIWPTTHASCRFATDANISQGKITYPYMECIGRHYNLLDKSGEYHPDLAYILTYPSLGQWDETKQNAVWCTDFARARGNDSPVSGAGQALYQEALQFEQFSDKTTSAEGANAQNPNINAQDKTVKEDLKIMANYEEQYLIVGPFSIDYINGIYENIAFGGISDMYFIGYNAQESIVKEKIKIEKYIYENKEYDIEFFEPDNYYVDHTEQSYPKGQSAGEEEFYLKIVNPNKDVTDETQMVSGMKLHIDFKWLGVTSANICEMDAHQYQVSGKHHETTHMHGLSSCYYCTWYTWLKSIDVQDHINVLHAERKLFTTSLEIGGPDSIIINITMQLGGHVWEDILATKESKADGVSNTIAGENGEILDKPLKNVKVTLYSCEKGAKIGEGEIVKFLVPTDISNDEIMSHVNPTYTDDNGNYLFKGLDPLKKYYVTFEYNGQIYLPTEYLNTANKQYSSVQEMVNAGLYNTKEWEVTSKGTETPSDREKYNTKFGEIRSYPENYETSNSLGKVGKYNAAFAQKELMGYTLDENGNYHKTQTQLIDGFLYDENGIETNQFSEGVISSKIREYILQNKKYPDENAIMSIYSSIAGNDQEIWKKLQFIEDCKITSYTQAQGEELDLYPVYDTIIFDSIFEIGNLENYTQLEEITIENFTYKPIYPGQLYINQGLWRRQINDVALRKDVYRAVTKINGKTEVYEYDKRPGEEEDYWQIEVRMRDYNNYYGTYYNRELFQAEYDYRAANTNLYGSELELYVTYKITISNQSQNILNEITEVVDYYDKDYTYMPNLSWVMYKDNNEEGYEKVAVPENSYYNMIHESDLSKIAHARDTKSSYNETQNNNGTYCGTSMYGSTTQQDLETKMNSVYIKGLEGKKLETGENAYIYLTFKVNPDSKGPVILDDDNSLKENYAEINGYKSYYKNGTELPNNIVIQGNDVIAGIIDNNSVPGNLCLKDLEGDKYEKNFENDTDRAKSIKVLIDETAIRSLNGIVWEDERTQTVSDSIIGDGIKQENEIGVQGVTVELVEKLENGKEFVWQTTTSGSNKVIICDLKTGEQAEYTNTVKEGEGKYEFSSFIPGNYIVRFKYGDTLQTVATINNGGKNAVSYNGQDFKSTLYAVDLANYTDEYYDIQAADKLSSNEKTNVSDAKDLWENRVADTGRKTNTQTTYNNETYQGRTNVNTYSQTVTNHKAEVLASPYEKEQNNELLQELITNTYMTAETAVIIAEVEYNRTNTDGYNTESNGQDLYLYGNDKNSNYTINHVDFGLTERPKAQLELGKKVTNVKISLANGNVLFDATQSADNLIWLSGKEYNINSKMKNNKYEEYYDKSKKDNNYHRYSYKTEIDKLITGLYPNGTNGLIQATMDEELMHGANIEISYKLTVKNVGETDYTGKDFYYKGIGVAEENKVTTASNLVVDYVANNLQYREADNQDWKVVKAEELTNNDSNKINERLVNNSLSEIISQYNLILQTSKLNTNLKPGEQATKDLFLTQIITPENKEDDKTYDNISEIVQISNTVGRRMAYSVVGNQNPTTIPSEVDSAKAERVIILPPFGQAYLYYGLAALAVIILIGGIIFIKKKVIKH